MVGKCLGMQIDLSPALEHKIAEIARQRAVPTAKLVEEVLACFLESLRDEPAAWVKAAGQRLPQVWPVENFADWMPPRGT